MDNSILTFEGHKVEAFELDGVIYFNYKDVGACLGLAPSSVRKAITNMSKNQARKLKNSIVQNLHNRTVHNTGEIFLTESGVYKLAFRSNKEIAESFTNWVTDVVLPQIRKTGGYIPTTSSNNVPLTDEQIMAQALLIAQKTLALRDQQIKEANLKLEEANKKVLEMEPKAEYYDSVLNARNLITVTDIAKYDYGMSAVALNKLLCSWGIQYRKYKRYYLYKQYDNLGYVSSKTSMWINDDGSTSAATHMMWTQVGRQFIHQQMKMHGYSTVAEKARADEMQLSIY